MYRFWVKVAQPTTVRSSIAAGKKKENNGDDASKTAALEHPDWGFKYSERAENVEQKRKLMDSIKKLMPVS